MTTGFRYNDLASVALRLGFADEHPGRIAAAVFLEPVARSHLTYDFNLEGVR